MVCCLDTLIQQTQRCQGQNWPSCHHDALFESRHKALAGFNTTIPYNDEQLSPRIGVDLGLLGGISVVSSWQTLIT